MTGGGVSRIVVPVWEVTLVNGDRFVVEGEFDPYGRRVGVNFEVRVDGVPVFVAPREQVVCVRRVES